MDAKNDRRRLPSVDSVLAATAIGPAIARYGRTAATDAVRAVLARARAAGSAVGTEAAAQRAIEALAAGDRPSLRRVFNLSGTVLHTNLGRALLADAAIDAATQAMRNAVALEFDVDGGKRGERDDHLRGLLCEVTGAQDATVVNNNAAAVLIVLNTFAKDRDAVVSRGELIEIGGAFRMPEIMARAGARLVEVGTTNRTHKKDYLQALGSQTGLILKVHTSNYRVEGFTAEVPARALAAIAGERAIPLVNDLGSGTLIDLARCGLKKEPTVSEAIREGADLVTFSGDKLLGGPQAGFIVGRSDLIAAINRNPMKRALRVDKIRLAALEATLKLYRDPDSLLQRLPTLRLLARPKAEIQAAAERMLPEVKRALGPGFTADIAECTSQIGSGALPLEGVASAGLALRSARHSGAHLQALSRALRSLPIPVVGHIAEQALILDLRCLEDEAGFVRNLSSLAVES
ncbi:L-seryl-tRNA(Sec) selenium transferase [Pseudorhodoplanes sp.]|uniref:L-seryl-tRNA(Sec) selenium transferase n=1 Tax=Pseudorhodoplanes sp. TaxID=1934341 RepID=UPI003D0FBDB1